MLAWFVEHDIAHPAEVAAALDLPEPVVLKLCRELEAAVDPRSKLDHATRAADRNCCEGSRCGSATRVIEGDRRPQVL